MSTAAPTTPPPPIQPDANRAMPPRIAQVLGVVRTLIAYGTDLADTLNQHASVPHLLPCFSFIATIFRSRDIALILARITRGLLRAAALEQRLRNRAARGRDIQPRSLRSPRKPRATKATTSPRGPAPAPHVPPTLEQIAAEDRRRPIGAILVDICLDLGIIPGQMDPASWNELGQDLALSLYGGDLQNLVVWRRPRRSGRRPRNPSFLPVSIPGQTGLIFPPWPAPYLQSEASTGPP